MSDPFSTFTKAVTKAVTDTAGQLAKTANDVADGGAKSLDEFTSGMNKEINDVGEKAKDGNFLGAAIELMDVGSPGSIGSEALAALGFAPKDPFVKELASGAINFMVGNPIGAMKDMGDAFGALSATGSRTSGRPAESHCPPRPSTVFSASATATGSVASSFASATAAASAAVGAAANGGYASINVNMNFGVGVHLHAATTLHAKLNVCMAHSPICRPPRAAINDAIRDSMRQQGIVQKGPSDPNQPLGERSISDILNDPTLSFEDMVALVMFKVCQDERAKVEAEMAKLTDDGESAGGSKKAAQGGKGAAAAGGGASGGQTADGGPLGNLLGGGGGGFDLGSVAKLGLAVATGGPGGLALAFASDPQMLSGAIGMAKGLAPMLAPLVSGALMAVPPIGPLIAPFVPMLLPMVLDVAEQAVGGMAGAGGAGSAAGGQEAQGAESGKVAGRAARGSAKGKKLLKEAAGKAGEGGKAEKNESTSRQETMEMIKIMMQRLQEMQQALSNVLNSMHQGAMNSIRNIK